MSDLKALLGKPESVTIGGLTFDMHPLKVNDMDIFFDLSNPEKQGVATKKLIDKVLLQSFPDSTPDERAGVAVEHMESLMEAIMRVNKLDKQKAESQVKLPPGVRLAKPTSNQG